MSNFIIAKNSEDKHKFCQTLNNFEGVKWTFYSFIVLKQLYFHQMLVAYAIIKLKTSDDVLKGINKLDYLIKVSVF